MLPGPAIRADSPKYPATSASHIHVEMCLKSPPELSKHTMTQFLKISVISVCSVLVVVRAGVSATPATGSLPPGAQKFIQTNCVACHEGKEAEGGLDLTSLKLTLSDSQIFAHWVRIFDRVHAGEMPPKDADPVPPDELKLFLTSAREWLTTFESAQWSEVGRVQGRRLSNLQLERSLHQVLGVDIPLAARMPEEPRTNGFTTVASGQPMSHFQLEEHLKVVDLALDNAFDRATGKNDLFRREFDGAGLSRDNPKRRTREPELIDGMAVTWSSRLIFYGRLPVTTAREEGWYRFTMRAKGLNLPDNHGVWCTVRTGKCVSSAPLLNWVTAVEVTEKAQESIFEAWIPRGEMLEVRPGDDTLKMGQFAGGQVGTGEGGPQNLCGIAIESLVMEQIHHGIPNTEMQAWLFGDLPVQSSGKGWSNAKLLSKAPKADAQRLMQRFAERTFRRPVDAGEVKPYLELVLREIESGQNLLAALRTGYRALLCSPRFLYFHESPGELDSYALASRLSYFLWSAPPDEELLALARENNLRSPQTVRQQVDRMLNDPRGKNFVKDFAAQWLDLSEIDFTTPDRRLYPKFDVIVQQSMLTETETFLQEMVDQNLSAKSIVVSDYTFLNERLARYYDIESVHGDTLQKVALRPQDHRGGLLTQGAILKVTANGTTTSPVIRGVWVSERLLGVEIPPPPAGVPAIEPDVRGAKTIREMLEKHKSNTACAGCHVKIDPPGFALENFDAAGRWRDNYMIVENRKQKKGALIDASHELPSGEAFKNVADFQSLMASQPERLAVNLAEQLLTYGTGARISFADRPDVEQIVANSQNENYGLRTIIQEVAASQLFRMK